VNPVSTLLKGTEKPAHESGEIWNLRQPSRFPIDAWGWDDHPVIPAAPRPKIVGDHSFDLVVNRKSRRPTTHVIRRLMAAFPDDFETASRLFEPAQWRLLFYLGRYPVAAIGDPCVDPHQAFQLLYGQDESLVDVPQEWTGAAEPASQTLCDIRVAVSDASPDSLKATWAILSLARTIGFEKNEVLVVPWWEVWWIQRYLDATM
jgi:hypothetical protein